MSRKNERNLWIPYLRENKDSCLRLFCFPHAGGSASMFHNWSDYFLSEIEICPVQYPGREGRMLERPFNRLTPLIDALANVMMPLLDTPFAFFGHSMGALVSFELARKLQKVNIHPEYLFVSSFRDPQIASRRSPLHVLDDWELLERMGEFHGTPHVILQNQELMNSLLPTFRADFAVHERYVYAKSALLTCPIFAFGGLEDTLVSYEELYSWRNQTSGNFGLQMYPGDHFYLRDHAAALSQLISKELDCSLVSNQNNQKYSKVRGKYQS